MTWFQNNSTPHTVLIMLLIFVLFLCMARVTFEDTFEILSIDSERFEKVSRIKAQAQTFLADIEIDMNTEIFPVSSKDTVSIALATAAESSAWDSSGARSGMGLIDSYEYALFGKIFKKVANAGDRVSVYASFGGLLMCLEGDRNDLEDLHLDDRLYFLLKKVY